MGEMILINRTFSQVRTALIIDGVVSEIAVEQVHEPSLVDNIYLGTVVRVLAGMQAAFVDIGRQKMAFLHADDLQPSAQKTPIERRLHQGERLLVQVIKDETPTKGARLSTNITLSSPLFAYRPYDRADVRVSSKLPPSERRRLMAILRPFAKHINLQGSIIARTQAADMTDDKLKERLSELTTRHQTVSQTATNAKLNKAKHAPIDTPSAVVRVLGRLVNHRTERILVDDKALFDEVVAYVRYLDDVPTELYQGDGAMFDVYGVERVLDEALSRQVNLPSGGTLIIERTEAMTVIDVNTAAFVGKYSDDKTICQTNIEAALTIARHIRLRNLGGMIVIDFINMDSPADQAAVMNALRRAISNDCVQVELLGMNELGLVMLTRKRTGAELSKQLCQPCAVCHGTGITKQPMTVAFEIIRTLLHKPQSRKLTIKANPSVIEYLHTHERQTLHDIERLTCQDIHLYANQSYHPDTYQIIYD